MNMSSVLTTARASCDASHAAVGDEARPARRGEEGATTVEYGLVAAAVGIVLVAAGPAVGRAFLDLIDLIARGFSA